MTNLRLTKAKTFEFDPAKKYLIQVKEGTLDEFEVIDLGEELKKMGVKNVLFVFVPKGKSLKVMESK